jgi:hypothetical protein
MRRHIRTAGFKGFDHVRVDRRSRDYGPNVTVTPPPA